MADNVFPSATMYSPEEPEVPEVPEAPDVPVEPEDCPTADFAGSEAGFGAVVSGDAVCPEDEAVSCCFPQAARMSIVAMGIQRFMTRNFSVLKRPARFRMGNNLACNPAISDSAVLQH